MEKPEVDEIDGIAPAIAIRQKNTTRNPRSTVATSTEIYDFMRLLWARAGRTFCPVCGRRVSEDTVDHVAQAMLAQPEASRYYVLFPIIITKSSRRASSPKDRLTELRARGFNRLWQSGTSSSSPRPNRSSISIGLQPVSSSPTACAIAPDLHQRIVDTVEACYRESGEAIFEDARTGERLLFSERFVCKYDNIEFREPEPHSLQLQQPRRRMPALPGLRQHHRLCAWT